MLQRFLLLAAACATLALTGCASVTGGSTQKMVVQAHTAEGVPVEAAECTLTNDKGSWFVRAPGEANIHRSNKAMEVRCRKPALPDGVVSVESGTRAAMYGNILMGGVIGVVIDHTSGAAYEYPERIRVVMGRMTSLTLPRAGSGSAPSGFADLKDVDSVPKLQARGRESYLDWLKRPQPRAFALGPNGYFAAAWGTHSNDASLPADPTERALALCERRAHVACKLYALNESVVWESEAPAMNAVSTTATPSPALAPAGSIGAPGRQPAAIASGYAAIEDVDAMPWLSNRGRDAYREWLTRPTPKAFAIGSNGYWFGAWSLHPEDTTLPADPTERALAGCTRNGGVGCRLYAVNGSVVFVKP